MTETARRTSPDRPDRRRPGRSRMRFIAAATTAATAGTVLAGVALATHAGAVGQSQPLASAPARSAVADDVHTQVSGSWEIKVKNTTRNRWMRVEGIRSDVPDPFERAPRIHDVLDPGDTDTWKLNHKHSQTTVRYANPRELHQTGEKSQVGSSGNEREALRRYCILAA